MSGGGVVAFARRIAAGGQTPRTDRTLRLDYRIRSVLTTETRGAAALLVATVAALVWANIPGAGYEAFWHTEFAVSLGDMRIAEDLRHWVNDGLMVFFFFVAGLEIRREFSLGDLRDRRTATVPIIAAVGGMVVPAIIFAVVAADSPARSAWGMAMATDIAFALGVLALVGPRCPANVRVFLLTLAIVDDIGAIAVIAVVYTAEVHLAALGAAAVLLLAAIGLRTIGIWRATPYLVVGIALWVATYASGLHPTIVGVLFGILTPAFAPDGRGVDRLERIQAKFRREPGPEPARLLAIAAQGSISSNDRLQYLLRPWTSFLVVPLFALANAGVALNAELLGRALHSPVTLGVFAGLVAGKTLGIWGASAFVVRTGLGRLPGGVGLSQVASLGAVAGIGFTVSLFIAELALPDPAVRDEAKVGIIVAAIVATGFGWVLFHLPGRRSAPTGRLQPPITPDDHSTGDPAAARELVQYGDYECPYCREAGPRIARALAENPGSFRYVWRHAPNPDVHPHAVLAARAAEAAAAQDAFWPMHEWLLRTTDYDRDALAAQAHDLGLDVDRFLADLDGPGTATRLERDRGSATDSGVDGTPTFFVDGERFDGALSDLLQ